MASIRRAQRPDTERREAIAWLRDCLSLGPRGAVELRELAEQHGFAFRTVQRAFRELQGVAWKDRSVRHGGWQWALPGAGGQVEGRSGGVVEEERQPEGEVEDAGSMRELQPLFPITAEMIEGEKRLLEILRRNDEEVAAFAARMKAEEAAREVELRLGAGG